MQTNKLIGELDAKSKISHDNRTDLHICVTSLHAGIQRNTAGSLHSITKSPTRPKLVNHVAVSKKRFHMILHASTQQTRRHCSSQPGPFKFPHAHRLPDALTHFDSPLPLRSRAIFGFLAPVLCRIYIVVPRLPTSPLSLLEFPTPVCRISNLMSPSSCHEPNSHKLRRRKSNLYCQYP